MEDNLPMADEYKSKGVTASPIRVIQLLYNSGVRFLTSSYRSPLMPRQCTDDALLMITCPLTTEETIVASYDD